MLAPGDRVEKLVERALIEQASAARDLELVELIEGGAILAGQVVALCMGAPPERVEAIGKALGQGGAADGD